MADETGTFERESERDPLTWVRITGELRVVVPDNLDLMTCYVLREQEDWFESETGFIRRLLRPGMQVMDIGANYGVYTLTAASLVGETGHLWAFEPSGATTACLRRSLELNGLRNVDVIVAGLSERCGTAQLVVNRNTELGFVSENPLPVEGGEPVELFSLDQCQRRYQWKGLDFIKMDAEGHESAIIRGGREVLRTHSPLIMYEIKAGDRINRDLVGQFQELGYASYRLVPGLNGLVPVLPEEVFDGYQLNLFCCKPDRAAALAEQGLLLEACVGQPPEPPANDVWQQYFERLPYGRSLLDPWKRNCRATPAPGWERYREALNRYVLACSPAETLAHRYGHLHRAHELLAELAGGSSNLCRILSYARVAAGLGRRQHAVAALAYLVKSIEATRTLVLPEPFLPPSAAYDLIDPGVNAANFVAASVWEAYERARTFSSYFSGAGSLEMLEAFKTLGFERPEMERRRQLVRMRAGRQQGPERREALARKTEDSLNPEYWAGQTAR